MESYQRAGGGLAHPRNMLSPHTLAALAAALCAPALARLAEDDTAMAILLMQYLFDWLTWPPTSYRLFEVVRMIASHRLPTHLIPIFYTRKAQDILQLPDLVVGSQPYEDAVDKEREELTQFRLSMLHHLPTRTVRGFQAQVFIDLTAVTNPRLANFVALEVIHLAEWVLQETPPDRQAGEPLFHALLFAKFSLSIKAGIYREMRQSG